MTCSPVVDCISRNVTTSHWSGLSNQALSDLRVRFHLNRCHPTFMSVLSLFLHCSSGARSCKSQLSSRTWPGTRGDDKEPIVSASILCVIQDCSSHPSIHPATVGNLPRQGPGLSLFGFPSCQDIVHGSRLAPCANEPSAGTGSTRLTVLRLDQRVLAYLCTVRIHSETFRRTSPTKPTVRESFPHRVRCQIRNSECNVHSRCCDHDVQSGQRSLSCRVLSTSRSSNSTRQRHCTSRHELLPHVSELAVASADCTHHMRNVSGRQSLRRSFSHLERVSPFVVLMVVPRFR